MTRNTENVVIALGWTTAVFTIIPLMIRYEVVAKTVIGLFFFGVIFSAGFVFTSILRD